ncbi:related to fructosyl amino acid oxidase [Phialocephala subalpina]|uniref:Related to fructosyl amino acid oxidase n=1 Tax=Phialocephala subalpina TaxID=576137 RepID=A0A1L7WYI4_9HELO|nr:related to fructosyl amino acid oxidase [Phialocephala subalpina]
MNSSVLILGAGTFGLSTAYHLAKAGYKNITVLDKASSIPSKYSAGYDLNKIVRAEYPDSFYSELALEAINAWKTPLFKQYYREVGYLLANSEKAPQKTKDTLRSFRATIASNPSFSGAISDIETREDIRKHAPAFNGPAKGWKGYFNKLAGYAKAADAMEAVYKECLTLGVRFKLGNGVSKLLYEGSKCTGARTSSGKVYKADLTIVALGACAASVLPSIGEYQKALGVPVMHVEVTSEEAKQLHGIPVTYARDLGFFFEPDPKTRLIKLCPATGGYTNLVDGTSVPPERPEDYQFTPIGDERRVRQLLRETLPALAERPFVRTGFCWFMETIDHDYIIDFVPRVQGLLAVSGDSGHGFKMLPVIGSWVLKTMQDGEQRIDRWKWKGPRRNALSLLPFETLDLKDVAYRVRM